MRECTQCGHELKEAAVFCDNCGASQDPNPKPIPAAAAVEVKEVQKTAKPQKSQHKAVGLLFAVVGLLLVIATVVIQAGQSYDAMAFITAFVGVIVIAIGLFIFFRGEKKN